MRCCITLLLLLAMTPVSPAQDRTATMSSDALSQLGALLDRDWKDRPEWAEMAVSILSGGGMGSGDGWFTGSERRHDWTWLSTQFPEAAADGQIEQDEIPQLSQAAFRRIDRHADRKLTSADFDFTSNPLMEDDSPAGSIFSRLDDDSNGRLTEEELQRWFKKSAGDSDFLSVEDLKGALGLNPKPPRPNRGGGDRPDPRGNMLEMLLNGEMGSFAVGPAIGDDAPELDLPLLDHSEEGELKLTERFVKLADVRGERPVVLIFGSFT